MPVLVITLVSFLETASSAKWTTRAAGTRWNENQDLMAHGLADQLRPCGGLCHQPCLFSRSAVNLYAGARTGWASVFSCALVLVALLADACPVPCTAVGAGSRGGHGHHGPDPAQHVAQALAHLAGRGVHQRHHLRDYPDHCAPTCTGVFWLGLLMNLSHYLYQRLHPRIIEVGLHPDGSLRDRQLWHAACTRPAGTAHGR